MIVSKKQLSLSTEFLHYRQKKSKAGDRYNETALENETKH